MNRVRKLVVAAVLVIGLTFAGLGVLAASPNTNLNQPASEQNAANDRDAGAEGNADNGAANERETGAEANVDNGEHNDTTGQAGGDGTAGE
jgi:hypothetical protein